MDERGTRAAASVSSATERSEALSARCAIRHYAYRHKRAGCAEEGTVSGTPWVPRAAALGGILVPLSLEMSEAPPAADAASEFRGSAPLVATNGSEKRLAQR